HPRRRLPPRRSPRRWPISARRSPTWTSPSSRPSGMPTPSVWKMPFTRSARWRADMMDRRTFLAGGAAVAGAAWSRPAVAQDAFPVRPITIINAFPPGGINDLVTRPAASALEVIFKQPVVVETKAGAAGAVGAQVAANARPDGYTLLSHNNGISSYAEVDKLFSRQPKATRADFIPLGRLCADPVLVLVNDQQPYKTLAEFVAAAKA